MTINRPTLIQILPQLLPLRCGVSDHALALATELRDSFGIDTTFVVVNSLQESKTPFKRVDCTNETLAETCNQLRQDKSTSLLLHYSGYGFIQDGAPFELAQALNELKDSGNFHIGIYFHEIYASGMPWQSAFWYARRQKRVARILAKEADFIATNMTHHVDWLKREVLQGTSIPFRQLPVFSTVGESQAVYPLSKRDHSLVLFGLPETRRRAYEHLSSMAGTLHRLEVTKIIDIGPEFSAPSTLNGIAVEQRGVLSAEELASVISASRFGFVPHPIFCLAKSSIFSSLCAMGAVPLVSSSFSGEMDGLRDGVHVISPETAKNATADQLQECATAAWQWYSAHNLKFHASTYADLLVHSSTLTLESARLADVVVSG